MNPIALNLLTFFLRRFPNSDKETFKTIVEAKLSDIGESLANISPDTASSLRRDFNSLAFEEVTSWCCGVIPRGACTRLVSTQMTFGL